MPGGKDGRMAGLCLRKGEDKRRARKNAARDFSNTRSLQVFKGRECFRRRGTSVIKVEQTDNLIAEDRRFLLGIGGGGSFYPVLSRQL